MPRWQYAEFEWDDGNIEHLADRHQTAPNHAESALRNSTSVRRVRGSRYEAVGRTDDGHFLVVVFEYRNGKVRVISARDL